jgi:iron complex outermembrane receptor protein
MTLSFFMRGGVQEYQATSTQDDVMTARVIFKRPALLYALATVFPFASLAEETVIVTANPSTPPARQRRAIAPAPRWRDENRSAVDYHRAVGLGHHPPADGGSGSQYHQPGAGIYPGVYSSFGGGATRFDTVSLRGYHGGDVDNLFLDGMRLMSDGGSHNVLQIDPWFIERVDVIRGPSSALYGQSVPGGVVNLTSKRPQFSRKAISA